MSNAINQALELAKHIKKLKLENKLDSWKPFGKQLDFLASKSHKKALVSGNQCLSGDTVIEDALTGESKRVDELEEFNVWAWNGKDRVIAKASKPRPIGIKPLVELIDGDLTYKTTLDHSILCSYGWEHLSSCVGLPECEVSHLRSSSELDLSTRVSNALRLMRIALSFRFDYQTLYHSHDEQLHYLQGFVQETLTSQAYALAHRLDSPFRSSSPSDAQACGSVYSHHHLSHDHHSIVDEAHRHEDQSLKLLSLIPVANRVSPLDLLETLLRFDLATSHQAVTDGPLLSGQTSSFLIDHDEMAFPLLNESDNGFLSRESEHRNEMLLQFEKSCQLLLDGEVDLCQLDILLRPLVVLASCIASDTNIVKIGSQAIGEAFEISVPGFGNYFIKDVLHKNCGKSQTLMYEAAIHLTGRYPSWWKGIRYDRPVEMWVVGVTSEKVRDNLQKALVGDVGAYGTGYLPKDTLDFTNGFVKKSHIPDAFQKVRVKHTSGSYSSVQFFSYEQSREYFQSSTIDIVCFDEEPPLPINNECRIRVLVKNGYMMYAFTPLTADPAVCRQLLADDNAEIISISMDEVPWLAPDMIEEMLHGLNDMERRARKHGIPASGSGTIFQFDPEDYSCESFEIPSHWPRIGGLDIGYNHPTGAVAIAWDRDSGAMYVYQEYKAKEKSAVEVARNLRSWSIQFATSHDAFNNTFQQGSSVADVFKDEGLHCFSAGRDPWARIEKARTLISDGRLFIFSDKCPELMKEMLTYHTKTSEAGKMQIHKKGEDVIDAFTHAVMFYEEAQLKGVLGKPTPSFVIKQWNPVDKKYGI